MLLNYLINSTTNLIFFFIKILLFFLKYENTIEIEIFSSISIEKWYFFLCKTLPIESSLFHLHLSCVTFAPTVKDGDSSACGEKNDVHPLRFSRGMLLQSWHLHHHAIAILLHWKLVKTVTTDRFLQRLVHQSYHSPTFQTFPAIMEDYHLSWLNKSCEAVSL